MANLTVCIADGIADTCSDQGGSVNSVALADSTVHISFSIFNSNNEVATAVKYTIWQDGIPQGVIEIGDMQPHTQFDGGFDWVYSAPYHTVDFKIAAWGSNMFIKEASIHVYMWTLLQVCMLGANVTTCQQGDHAPVAADTDMQVWMSVQNMTGLATNSLRLLAALGTPDGVISQLLRNEVIGTLEGHQSITWQFTIHTRKTGTLTFIANAVANNANQQTSNLSFDSIPSTETTVLYGCLSLQGPTETAPEVCHGASSSFLGKEGDKVTGTSKLINVGNFVARNVRMFGGVWPSPLVNPPVIWQGDIQPGETRTTTFQFNVKGVVTLVGGGEADNADRDIGVIEVSSVPPNLQTKLQVCAKMLSQEACDTTKPLAAKPGLWPVQVTVKNTGNLVASFVTVSVGDKATTIGNLMAGETKTVVVNVSLLASVKLVVVATAQNASNATAGFDITVEGTVPSAGGSSLPILVVGALALTAIVAPPLLPKKAKLLL